MRPTTALPLVTTREPTFFAYSQLVALLTLASGTIVATSAPFCLRMLSTDIDIASSNRMALLPISSRPRNWGACHGIRSPLRGALAYHIGRKQSASIGDRATDQSLANWCGTGSGQKRRFGDVRANFGLTSKKGIHGEGRTLSKRATSPLESRSSRTRISVT